MTAHAALTAVPSPIPITLNPAPTWGQVDGLDPAVLIWIEAGEIELSIDLTPTQALQLAAQLLRAVAAVQA